MLFYQLATWLAAGSTAFAATIPRDASPLKATPVLVERQATSSSPVPDGACTNSPRTRNCWSDGFSIATDFDAKAPPAGKTVTYDLTITNTTLNPDGAGARLAMLINGEYPGPTIRATWGDTVVVNVKNELQHNGTGIHWHGLRQLNSCQHDGVPGVTECPIAPGKTRQYVFKATQFGTSWYHSHWSAQYAEGIVGTIVIDGPAAANYDEDLGPVALTEWYYTPGFEINEQAQLSRTGPPAPDIILVNGKHKSATGTGEYYKMTVKKGKKYRVRLINTSVDTTFHVSFDGHPMTVMTADFVPIKSFETTQITLNIGQRYDVVINANQTAGNYWMRVAIGTTCGSNLIIENGVPKIPLGAILHYDTAPDAQPTSTGVTMRTDCNDEPESSLRPFVPNTVPQDVVVQQDPMNVASVQNESTENLFRWTVDSTTLRVNWSQPSLRTVLQNGDDFGPNTNIYEIPTRNNWYLWHIQNHPAIPLPHPIHLHGHDFYIVGKGAGTWDGNTAGLTFSNPTRRDTAMLPALGYLLIAFPADNPGNWIMHCHIAWHASQGLSVQFLESRGSIAGTIGNTNEFNKGCAEWDEYWQPGNHPYEQTDSGI